MCTLNVAGYLLDQHNQVLVPEKVPGYLLGYTRVSTRLYPGIYTGIPGYLLGYTRVSTRVYPGIYSGVPGYVLWYDQHNQVWYPITAEYPDIYPGMTTLPGIVLGYPSMVLGVPGYLPVYANITRYGTRVSEYGSRASRVPVYYLPYSTHKTCFSIFFSSQKAGGGGRVG